MNSLVKIQGKFKVQGALQFTYSNAEITNWISNINRYNLTLPNQTVLDALSTLLASLRQYNLRNKIRRLNLFCGGDYISSFFPIIADIGNTWDYNGISGNTVTDLSTGPFKSSDWSLTTGFNASSNAAYVNSGNITGNTNTNTLKVIDSTVPANTLDSYSAHMGCYISADSPTNVINQNTDMGIYNSASEIFNLQAAFGGNTSPYTRYNCYYQNLPTLGQGDTAGGVLTTNFTTAKGFYIGTRQSNNLSTIFKNTTKPSVKINGSNASYNPNTNTASARTLDTSTLFVFCRTSSSGRSGINRQVANVTDRGMYMYTLGTGLTDTDVIKYNNIISTFNTAIGRTNYTTY